MLTLIVAACATPSPTAAPAGDADPADTGADSAVPENHAPAGLQIAIVPAAPSEASTLSVTFVAEAVDPDGDPVGYEYAWTRDGSAVAEAGETVGPELTADGETWAVTVTPSDGRDAGTPATASATIGNQPPSAPVVHLEPAAPRAGDRIYIVFDVAAVDPNMDRLITTYTWEENGAVNPLFDGDTAIAGDYVAGGDSFRVVVTVTDGLSDAVVTEASVSVGNTVPVIESVRISPEEPLDGENLVATVKSEDGDEDELTTTYTWRRDGVDVPEAGNERTLEESYTSPGESWTVLASVSDGVDTVTMESDPVLVGTVDGYRVVQVGTLTVAADGTAAGSFSAAIASSGSRYGTSSCDVSWTLAATPDSTICPRCDYAFSAAWTYDAASTVDFGCDAIALDGTGNVQWYTSWPSGEWYAAGPSLYPAASYYGATLSLMTVGDGGYSSGYPYTRTSVFSTEESVDASGYTVLYSYSYRYVGY